MCFFSSNEDRCGKGKTFGLKLSWLETVKKFVFEKYNEKILIF